MTTVLEITATAGDARHMTLHRPLDIGQNGSVNVHLASGATKMAGRKSEPVYPSGWLEKTPEERAASFLRWVEKLPKDGPGLSDYAVSRDSIYE